MAEDIGESELGRLDYWDERYVLEIENFKDHGDLGEIWFGDDIVDRTTKWMEKNIPKTHQILDVGCGNGMFLINLHENGYKNLTGIDYSAKAIDLAQLICESKKIAIDLQTFDIVNNNLEKTKYDLIHDKGTFDAISLSIDSKQSKISYIENISKTLKNDGRFLITSCNWTKDELIQHFIGFFQCIDSIPTPIYKFGGKTGNTVTSLVFVKINE